MELEACGCVEDVVESGAGMREGWIDEGGDCAAYSGYAEWAAGFVRGQEGGGARGQSE